MTNLRLLGSLSLGTLLVVAGCRSSSNTGYLPDGGAGMGGSSAGAGGSAGSGTGGSGGTAAGGSAGAGATGGSAGSAGGGSGGTAGAGTGGSSAGGTAGAGGGACTGAPATVQEIQNGTVGMGVDVNLTGVVATSQKFLVSRSNATGSCLWGMFVSAPVSAAAEYTGLMVVAYGTPAVTDADGGLTDCLPGTDAIPDDVVPGDVLDVYGSTDEYAPSACATQVKQKQLRAFQTCPLVKTGAATPPTPAPITTTVADTLAAGTDAATVNRWSGVLVQLSGVTGTAQDGGGVVGPYGIVRLNETALEVHDPIYYKDLLTTPGSDGGPQFSGAPTFTRIDGLMYLDYCTWSLNPRDKCADFAPKSEDCP